MPDAALGPLVDKLAERLAYEQLGACYWAVLVSKANALGPLGGRPYVEELEEVLDEAHALMDALRASLADLGGERAVVRSPGATATLEATRILALIADPRRSVLDSLEVVLVAKLADRAGWQALVELASSLGRADIAARCQEAWTREDQHVGRLRAWLAGRADPVRALERELGGDSGAGA